MEAPSPIFPTKYYPSQRRIIRVSPNKITSWRKNVRKLQKDIRSLPLSPRTNYISRPADAIVGSIVPIATSHVHSTTSEQSTTRGSTFSSTDVPEKQEISANIEEFPRRACPIQEISNMSSSSENPCFSQSSSQSEKSSLESLFGTPEENILDVRFLFPTMKKPLRLRSIPRPKLQNKDDEFIEYESQPSIESPETGNTHSKIPELPLPLKSQRMSSSSSFLSLRDPRRSSNVSDVRSIYYVEPDHVTIPPRITSPYFEKSKEITSDIQDTSTSTESSVSLLSTMTSHISHPEPKNVDNLEVSQISSQSEKSSHCTLFGTSEENILDARILFPFKTSSENAVIEPPVFDAAPPGAITVPPEPPELSTPKSFGSNQYPVRSSVITSLEILQALRKRASPSDVDSEEAVPNIKFYRVADTRLSNATSVQQTSHNMRFNKNDEKRHKLSKEIRTKLRRSVPLSTIHNVPRGPNQGNVGMYTSLTENNINIYNTSSESGLGSSLNRNSIVKNNTNPEESRNSVMDEGNATITRIIPKIVPQPKSRMSQNQDIYSTSSNQVEHQELVVDYDDNPIFSPIFHESGIYSHGDVDSEPTNRNQEDVRDNAQEGYDLGLSSTSDSTVTVTQETRMPTTCPTSQSQVRTPTRRTEKPSRSSLFLEFLSDYIRKRDCPPEVMYFKNDFFSTRGELCDKLFRIFNRKIFSSKLPRNMLLVWNDRRYTTRSVCAEKRISHRGKRSLQIELSSKLIKTTGILRDAVIKELCNAAAWLLDESGNLLGATGVTSSSTKWARKAVKTFPIVAGLYSICQTFETFNMDTHYVCIDCQKRIRYRSRLPNAIRCSKCEVFYVICSNFPNSVYTSPYRASTSLGGPLYCVPSPAYLPNDAQSSKQARK